MTRLSDLLEVSENLVYSPEGISIMEAANVSTSPSIYILLTDTKTQFSKISKLITGDPYNHVSLMLTDDFKDPIYTYSISNGFNAVKGGFMVEDIDNLYGSLYSLYKLNVTEAAFKLIEQKVVGLAENPSNTSYNHLGVFNAIFRKNIFNNPDGQTQICSEFVVEVLDFAGINLFQGKASSTIRPYDLIRSKLLKFVRRGKIK
jgi:hypothetical protein